MQCLCLRIGDGTANTAADNSNLFHAVIFCGNAQRADKILNGIANLLCGKQLCGKPYLLEDNGNGAFFSVIICDGKRNSFAEFIHAEDDELTCLCLFGNKGCFNLQQSDHAVELSFIHDTKHGWFLPFSTFGMPKGFSFGSIFDNI